MTSLKEIDIVYALTAPDEAQRYVSALVEYLRKGKAGSYLLDALADMLDENGDSVWQLRLTRRDTRHIDDAETVKRKAAAHERVRELSGLIADRDLIGDIVKELRAKWRGSSWKVEPRKDDGCCKRTASRSLILPPTSH